LIFLLCFNIRPLKENEKLPTPTHRTAKIHPSVSQKLKNEKKSTDTITSTNDDASSTKKKKKKLESDSTTTMVSNKARKEEESKSKSKSKEKENEKSTSGKSKSKTKKEKENNSIDLLISTDQGQLTNEYSELQSPEGANATNVTASNSGVAKDKTDDIEFWLSKENSTATSNEAKQAEIEVGKKDKPEKAKKSKKSDKTDKSEQDPAKEKKKSKKNKKAFEENTDDQAVVSTAHKLLASNKHLKIVNYYSHFFLHL
jgi:hypothetical protein